ncbi:hypothetical protein [Snodgrassella sp. B3882]
MYADRRTVSNSLSKVIKKIFIPPATNLRLLVMHRHLFIELC